jgi:small subunit ribosomal protein S9
MLVDSQSKTQSKPKALVATIAPPLPETETPFLPKPTVPPKRPDTPDINPDLPTMPDWPDNVPLSPDISNPFSDLPENKDQRFKNEASLAQKEKTTNADNKEQHEINVSEKSEKELNEPFFSGAQGTGRRKSAIARVQLHSGTGHIVINKKRLREYLQGNRFLIEKVLAPLKLVRFPLKEKALAIRIFVYGGGLMGQADAIQLGISRALCQYDKDYRRPFKTKGFLTRDARVKERKKYGLKKARKASQYSKR